jgi:hypothetical protein
VLYDRLFSVLCIVMSRKFILFCSFFMVNCNFGWMLLNSCNVRFMLVSSLLYINRALSTYLIQPFILCFRRMSYMLLCYRNCGNISAKIAEDGVPIASLTSCL